jgi:hypothetical protein
MQLIGHLMLPLTQGVLANVLILVAQRQMFLCMDLHIPL